MKRQEHIEDLIRQKLEEKEFPYDASFWAGARKTIAVDARKRRRRLLLWMLIGLAALIIAAFRLWPDNEGIDQVEHPQATLEKTQDSDIKLWNASDDDSTQTNKLFITRNASEAPPSGASNEAYSRAFVPASGISPVTAAQDKHGADFQHSAVSGSRTDGKTDLAFSNGKQASERSDQTVSESNRSDGSSDTDFFHEEHTYFQAFRPLPTRSSRLLAENERLFLTGIRRHSPRKSPDWFFQLGGGGALGLNGEHHRYLEAGLAGRFYIHPRLQLLGGASYWLRLNKNQPATRRVTEYDYTSRTTVYRLHVHQMHYLELWAGLEYQAAPRLSLQLGLGGAILLSNLATYQVNEHYRAQVYQVEHRKTMGFREGFQRWDWRIRTGLAYRLNALSELALDMRVGLTDITDNAHFGAAQRDVNTFAGITLRYKMNRR